METSTLTEIPTSDGETIPLVTGLNQYQSLAEETAIYPRMFVEDQVKYLIIRAYVRGSQVGEPVSIEDAEDWAYQDMEAVETPFNKLVYPILGLVGEAGEIANKAKKIARDQQGRMDTVAVEDSTKELGDVMWYVAAIATEINTSLGVVASRNIQKLFSRRDRGVLGGSGDNR